MKTAVMTDSNSGIKPEEAESLGIFSLPMPVIIDDIVYYEGKDITEDKFYQELLADKNVTTSQPSPGDVMDMWDKILEKGYDQIVYIPMSSGLSASCHAATQLSEDYDGKVQVVDNHRISVTLRESVFDAIDMADKGATALEIKEKLEAMAYDSVIYIAVDTLKFLQKGGRVTPAGAALGTVLNIKPILTIQGDKLDAFAKVRGMKKCQIKMIEAIREDINTRFANVDNKHLRMGVASTLLSNEEKEDWINIVKESFPEIETIIYDDLSFSIGCHVGPNALGVCVGLRPRD